MTIIKKRFVWFVESVSKKKKKKYEWARWLWMAAGREGAHEVLLIDECSDAAPQHLLEQHMRIKTVTTDNHLFKLHAH